MKKALFLIALLLICSPAFAMLPGWHTHNYAGCINKTMDPNPKVNPCSYIWSYSTIMAAPDDVKKQWSACVQVEHQKCCDQYGGGTYNMQDSSCHK